MTKYFNPVNNIDLSLLPKPDLVENLDYEELLESNKQVFLDNLPAEIRNDVANTIALESEPITILLQVMSYKEMILRQRVNDAARATMLAFAQGADLDHFGASRNVYRQIVQEEDLTTNPPTLEVLETDDSYRKRIQLSPESFTTAGPYSAYLYHAISADGAVKDVSITRPRPGDVAVYVMSHTETGLSSEVTITNVSAALNDENVRPLNDTVLVRNVSIVNYSIQAEIVFYTDSYQDLIYQTALDSLQNFIARNHLIGRDITRSGIIASLKVEGVQDVIVTFPEANVIITPEEVGYCTSVEITRGGVIDE